MAGTNAPALLGTETNPAVDARQVKYWITMSLPTYWTPPPSDAKPEEIYLYRPDFYQDEDGIARRITLWFNPKARSTLQDLLGGNTPGAKTNAGTSPGHSDHARRARFAAEATPAHNPFRSPLDDAFHPHSGANHHDQFARRKFSHPRGMSTPDSPVALPATNAAPANPQ